MHFPHLFGIFLFLSIPTLVSAHPVINEVLWAGSDLSTSDEWIEIWNPEDAHIDITGWRVTSLNSKGEHVTVAEFGSGSFLAADEYIVIARKFADASRLLDEPLLVSSSLVLQNTNLLLRLVDADGNIIDEVDDGTGGPFAGANPSGTGSKASMERVRPEALGTAKDSWRTAFLSFGFDEGARMLGTPGSENPAPSKLPPDECFDPLTVRIDVQSGETSGIGKVTLNAQAIAETGTLGSQPCTWDFGDGFTSTSCNPPSHSFTNAGEYVIHLSILNRCDIQLHDELSVVVTPDDQDGTFSASLYDDGSKLLLVAALPNPEGVDTGREWIEIRNLESRGVLLAGWKIRIGETASKWINMKGSMNPQSTLRIYDSEQKLSLPNTAKIITLISPSGEERSEIEWMVAEEGREYYPSDLRKVVVHGRVLSAIGSTVLQVQLDEDAAEIAGTDQVYVKLLGITAVPPLDETEREERMNGLSEKVKGKTVELEFDSELWDSMGRLLAYVYTDQQFTLQRQLLISGGWMVDRTADFVRKKEFLALELPMLHPVISEEKGVSSSAPEEEKKFAEETVDLQDWSGVYFSEIFPSPDPKADPNSDVLTRSEWIELSSSSQSDINLSGAILQSGTRKKRLPEGLILISGSRLVVSFTDLHLALPNAGSKLTLFDPAGNTVDSFEYPKVPSGQAYAKNADEDAWCVTTIPTPGLETICTAKASTASKTKKTATVSPAIKSYAQRYLAQLESAPTMHSINSRASRSSTSFLYGIASFFLGFLSVGFIVLFAYRMGFVSFSYERRSLQKK